MSAARRFRFTDRWTVSAPAERVRDVVIDLEYYPVWWPQVRAVASLGPDDARLLIRSTLPYTLDLVLHAVSRELPELRVELDGDLRGWARWRLHPESGGTGMDFAQEVELMRLPTLAARAARPLLRWNHARMMAGCRAGLARRLGQDAPGDRRSHDPVDHHGGVAEG